jgi:hypothetical protein
MADNRMWLVNRVTGSSICLAKYYRATGWHVIPTADKICEMFNADAFSHLSEEERKAMDRKSKTGPPFARGSQFGDDWEIRYRRETGKPDDGGS